MSKWFPHLVGVCCTYLESDICHIMFKKHFVKGAGDYWGSIYTDRHTYVWGSRKLATPNAVFSAKKNEHSMCSVKHPDLTGKHNVKVI